MVRGGVWGCPKTGGEGGAKRAQARGRKEGRRKGGGLIL